MRRRVTNRSQIRTGISARSRAANHSFLLIGLAMLFGFVSLMPSMAAEQEPPKTHVEEVPVDVSHPDPVPQQSLTSGGTLKGEVQQNRAIEVLLGKLGMAVKPTGKETLPAQVVKVAAGSAVAKRGIVNGDTLIGQATNNDGSVTLTMEHAGQGFRFTVGAAELAASTAKTDIPASIEKTVAQTNTNKNASVLQSGANKNTAILQDPRKRTYKSIIDVLENHDLGLIIDRSGSMSTRDCPGGLSRWDWCCQEATQLAEAAAQASSSIDASVFNISYLTYQHISPAQIPQIFATNRPAGGTEPAYALQEQLENFFKSSKAKPLTIVIVTDGLPNNCRNIAQVLQDESQKIGYQGEVTITFLLIGNEVDDVRLRNMIGLTPDSSVKNGGFVDIVPFSELEGKGIRQALFEDLREARLCTDPHKPSKASTTALGPSAANRGLYPASRPGNFPHNGITNYGTGNYPQPGVRSYSTKGSYAQSP